MKQLQIDWAQGSSPLTRGKLVACGVGRRPPGLIPAHAGKTPGWPHPAPPGTAHPRSRGENLEIANPRGEGEGSSPLTRGKLQPINLRDVAQGLIPAHAGKTRAICCPRRTAAAHPRSRGENYGTTGVPFCAMGSSPLTRGKQDDLVSGLSVERLIPAHAGKTCR